MSTTRRAVIGATASYGSIEITEDRAIYTDVQGVRWRLHDFAYMSDGKRRVRVRVGALSAHIRIFVREDGLERRRIQFSSRDDTLSPSFNHWQLQTALVQQGNGWAQPRNEDDDRRFDKNHPHARRRYH